MRYGAHGIYTGTLAAREFLGDFHISVRDVPEHPDYPDHTHEFHELVLTYEGSGVSCIDGVRFPIAAGDVFVVHPGSVHSYEKTQHLHLANVLFDKTLTDIKGGDTTHLPGFHALFQSGRNLGLIGESCSRLRLASHQMLNAQSLVEELETEVDGKPPGFRLISQSLLLLLVGKLSRWYSAEMPHVSGAGPAIARAIAYIEERFYDSLSIESLADASGLSERSFYRSFKCATGVSPHQYVTNVRLSHAAQLLAHSSMSITDIAFECGFHDGSHMATLFKNRTGLTPRVFRANRA